MIEQLRLKLSQNFRCLILCTVAVMAIALIVILSLVLSKKKPECQATFEENTIQADFIVIGGGTAGCVVAARLAEHGYKTLLLSSGMNDTSNPILRQQSLFSDIFRQPHLKHHLPVNPSLNLNNRTLSIYAWNTLGGNSINGGGIERMMTNSWNYFMDATNDSSYHPDHMSQYYQMVENFTSNRPESIGKHHGTQGPLKISHLYSEQFTNLWRNVAEELNETFTDDLSNEIDYGFSFEATTFTDGIRSWSADAYIRPALQKYANLEVITGATAIKLNVDETNQQIQNVLFVSKNGLFSAVARKEYVLSAGVFYSPHLLMLSGIGDPRILEEHDIPVKHSLKQVGKNLADNGAVTMKYKAENFSLDGTIPVALVNNQKRTNHTNPNTFFILKKHINTDILSILVMDASPTSTIGSITLYSSNPLIPPKINLDYLTDRTNLENFVNAIQYVRKVMLTDTLKNFAEFNEISPGINQTDLHVYVKNTLEPALHFMGTCSMGKSAENSVVNHKFQVHGIDNLRIVDASIFPASFTSKSGPFFTIHALAEKAVAILHQKYA